MFGIKDNTYNELREKAIIQWLDELKNHDDAAVRGGVKVTEEYLMDLKKQIANLENQNKLKDKYLKKLKLQK